MSIAFRMLDGGAHPRVCGENSNSVAGERNRAGSSPRVRGKLRPRLRPRPYPRLIPACAGKTIMEQTADAHGKAHPRVCGENGHRLGLGQFQLGSSPRVRGKPHDGMVSRSRDGLIPACAGKTSYSCRCPRGVWAHPRVCGENWATVSTPCAFSGSSPRVRGKPSSHVFDLTTLRLIPACAGKTFRVRPMIFRSGAHPRVCGENARTRARLAQLRGSSPRVRGKLEFGVFQTHSIRLIPACAGKTGDVENGTPKRWAHPRVCGENSLRRLLQR